LINIYIYGLARVPELNITSGIKEVFGAEGEENLGERNLSSILLFLWSGKESIIKGRFLEPHMQVLCVVLNLRH